MDVFLSIFSTLCGIELLDIVDFMPDYVKLILMLIVTILSLAIQIWRAIKGNKEKTTAEKVLDEIYDELADEKKTEKTEDETEEKTKDETEDETEENKNK